MYHTPAFAHNKTCGWAWSPGVLTDPYAREREREREREKERERTFPLRSEERERERQRQRQRETERERERVVTRGLCPNGRKEGRKSRGEFGPGSVRAAKSAKLPKLERSSNRGHEPRTGCTPSSPTKEEKDSWVFMPSSVV